MMGNNPRFLWRTLIKKNIISFSFHLYLIYPLNLVLQRGTKSFVCIIQRDITRSTWANSNWLHPVQGRSICPFNVHFTHSKLCLIVPCHPVAACAYLCMCTGGMYVQAAENLRFVGFTPFHSVIQISIFALIIHPKNTEGGPAINHCFLTCLHN